MSKVSRNLSTKENREFWQSVDKAADEVRRWPLWKSGVTVKKDVSASQLLTLQKSYLEGCLLAITEELQNKTEEFELKKQKALSGLKAEIKGYRKEIKKIERLTNRARKVSSQSSSLADRESLNK